MNRRRLLQIIAALPVLRGLWRSALTPSEAAPSPSPSRVRPGDPAWPSQGEWDQLANDVGGRLIKVESPLAACVEAPEGAACAEVFKELKNPYYLGDEVALTQSLGWVDAWTSRPSVYAVAAETTADVVAAVNFARRHNLRLVVKGGGHSYFGGSNAADSLLIWTRKMDAVAVHDAFVGAGSEGLVEPARAVTAGAGAIWRQVYGEVTTKAGRYVQGGGCLTVGVAGLICGGGFGSFSKRYGLAAASLLEAEIVTADGEVRIANSHANPDLYWAIKGGGGGFGVVTRMTLRTHELPQFFGGVYLAIQATTDDAHRRLIGKIVEFYAEKLFNPHWGEQLVFGPDVLAISMVFQGIGGQEAEAVWRPFFDWIAASPADFAVVGPARVLPAPARYFWDPTLVKLVPGVVLSDDRPGASEDNIFWTGNLGEAGIVWHGYQSAWLPASLLKPDQREKLSDALFAATKHGGVSLHINKGLAGAPADAIEAAKDTAMNPAVVDAFALAISATGEQPAYPGVAGHEPDVAAARKHAEAIARAMSKLRELTPNHGSYVLEANFFEPNWQDAFWGANYPKLRAVKDKYDPAGLFFVHHGVGSEDWSEDGFTRRS
jgi:FAD/FMN-containing dehydrogenase